MKAISVLQPWASLLACGAKRIETRSWSTPYRGEIAIHASKKFTLEDQIDTWSSWTICGALSHPMEAQPSPVLPVGAVIATAHLVDCRPTGSFTVEDLDSVRSNPLFAENNGWYDWTERILGNFKPGRFGLVLDRVTPLSIPVPARGFLGLWDWNPS